MMLTFGSLFAGIGGIDLGLERAGMRCAWQVEIDDYATRVLAKHWPDVHRERDVRACGARNLAAVDLIAGGFPCQPHSVSGERRAGGDDRDLWPEYRRIICELKPRWVLAENVPGLLSSDDGRFFGCILRDLAELGYDAEWSCIPAGAIGAAHLRNRVFLVAYIGSTGAALEKLGDCGQGRIFPATPQPALVRCQERSIRSERISASALLSEWAVIHGVRSPEPFLRRMAHGIPDRVDRLRGLGNAVVPQVAEFIGRQIVAFDLERSV